MAQKVRVRFAPSPTGPLHIGGVRTALFNYLFAKKHKGDFILRIEDTDQSRYVEGAEDYIIESLHWLSIPFDEGPGKEAGFGPYRQSERKHLYKEYAEQLIASGNAYYAFDTTDSLSAKRAELEADGKTFIYNWHNREQLDNSLSMPSEETQSKLEAGDPYVIRFKSPKDRTLKMMDIIRGEITIDTNILDDKVLFKSDGMPTYHLANIVDDHLMEITHVIRGEEWLPSLALHQMLYEALDWQAPEFAHLPLIMKPIGKGKLSKRDGEKMGFPVFPLEWKTQDGEVFTGYRESGYLPEAVVNMLALLGWNPGTEQEIFSLKELIAAFNLDRVNKAGAKFDPEKTKWFQHHYLQQVDNKALCEQFLPILESHTDSDNISRFTANENKLMIEMIELVKERATFVGDLWEQLHFFFETPENYDEKASKKAFKEDTPELLASVADRLNVQPFDAGHLSNEIKGWISSAEIGFGKVMMPLRLSLVGAMKGPDVFEIMALLGKEESERRIKSAIEFMS